MSCNHDLQNAEIRALLRERRILKLQIQALYRNSALANRDDDELEADSGSDQEDHEESLNEEEDDEEEDDETETEEEPLVSTKVH